MYGVPNNAILIGVMLSLLAFSVLGMHWFSLGLWFMVFFFFVDCSTLDRNWDQHTNTEKKICFLFFLFMPTYCFVTDESV